MSLGVAFKGPEGIVLAADSRVTLTAEMKKGNETMSLPSTFDHATKLLKIEGHEYVGAVTYGLGAIGLREPRTAHSFMPEFEEELSKVEAVRLSVQEFAEKFSEFFMRQWKMAMPPDYPSPDMTFLIGGYDEGAPYGKVYEINIPKRPAPEEKAAGQFGVSWGGQLEFASRLLRGFDPELPSNVKRFLGLTDEQTIALEKHLEGLLSARIPYAFLPLQDCVNLSIFMIRITIEIQNWIIGVRGVGGAIDVATITRTEGFAPIQRKHIMGEREK